jgi:hypothetical protein
MEAEPWEPSVKSPVPFPVVLAASNSNLTWVQQLSYDDIRPGPYLVTCRKTNE